MPKGRLRSQRSLHNAKDAFTLVELLVALFIFVVAVGASFATFNSSAHLVESAHNRMVALQDARAVLEEVKTAPLSEVPNIVPNNFRTKILNASAVWVNVLSNENITPATNPLNINGATALATATVTVTWKEVGGRQQTLSLTTQKSAY